jgi:diazepam-binding inhibitor (GABA receptor modulating acyl-CoA-binding protein)
MKMDSEDFEAAQMRVKNLTSSPKPNRLLELYALYKQATIGDVSGARPGVLDMRGRAKFDAWSKKQGLSETDAKTAYVHFVEELFREQGGSKAT